MLLLRTGKEPFPGDAHDLLCWAYKNPELPAYLRLDAAKAAMRYERPRLAAIKTVGGDKHEHEYADLDEAGRIRWARDLIAKATRLAARSRPPTITNDTQEVEAAGGGKEQ